MLCLTSINRKNPIALANIWYEAEHKEGRAHTDLNQGPADLQSSRGGAWAAWASRGGVGVAGRRGVAGRVGRMEAVRAARGARSGAGGHVGGWRETG